MPRRTIGQAQCVRPCRHVALLLCLDLYSRRDAPVGLMPLSTAPHESFWLLSNTSIRHIGLDRLPPHSTFRWTTGKSRREGLPWCVRCPVPSAVSDRTRDGSGVLFNSILFEGTVGSIAPRDRLIAGRDVELRDWVMRAPAGARNRSVILSSRPAEPLLAMAELLESLVQIWDGP
jgi:hypothetical protein